MKILRTAINSAQSNVGKAVYVVYDDGDISCYDYYGIDDASIILQARHGFSQEEADYQGPDCIAGVHPNIAEYYGISSDSSENLRDYYNSGEYEENLDSAESNWDIHWVN